jgi:branched-chain amino acid transport system substrate-binding protein
MKRLILLILSVGLLIYALRPQWQSFDQMGERRFRALSGTPKEIVLGVCWPFSINQDGMADGLQLALDELNATKFAGGIPIRLILRDDAFDWEKAKQIAIEFSDNPAMSAVLGYYDDSRAIKASSLFESSRLLHVIIGANSTAMTDHGLRYLIRTILASNKIAKSLARMSVDRGHKKVALIWEEGAYGEDLAYQYRVALDALNGRVVYQWSYVRERADFRMPVNELKGVDADVIFFSGLEPWAGDFVRMARAVGVTTEFVGAFSDTPEMRSRAGSALEGAMYFDEYNVSSTSPNNQAFVRKFRARYAKDPDTWAAQAYDALYIVAKAVRATKSANPLDLSYAIRFMDPWEGVNGRYKFDSRGELEDKPIFLNVYRNGTPVTFLESPPISVPESVPEVDAAVGL